MAEASKYRHLDQISGKSVKQKFTFLYRSSHYMVNLRERPGVKRINITACKDR